MIDDRITIIIPNLLFYFTIIFYLFSFFPSPLELPTLAGDIETMEVASVPLTRGLPPPGHKPSKKEAKLMQQRLERLARVNIHLHGKIILHHNRKLFN